MPGISERNKQKEELANIGFSLRYIDEWQPKTTLYRHKPSYTVGGALDSEIGTAVSGVPGNPDYVLRKAKTGLFPWLPSDSCTCRWCGERKAAGGDEGVQVEGAAEALTSAAPSPHGRGNRRMGPYFKAS